MATEAQMAALAKAQAAQRAARAGLQSVAPQPVPPSPPVKCAVGRLGYIEGQTRINVTEGIWEFDDDDWALFAMLCDPVYMSELLFVDPKNREHGGCYRVMDYQYPLFRTTTNYEMYPCARSVGKTESIKAKAVCHAFKRQGEDMLLTAPEMIHLHPLTQAVETRIRDTRLTEEFLDMRNQKTGITHKPFQVDFLDGTKIVGRIPKLMGTGLKGMHEPDMLVDESQDFPERGYVEAHETVDKAHVDQDGKPDFSYLLYGVHAGGRDGSFYRLSQSGDFRVKQITALMRPGWGPEEKRRAAAIYGGTQSPDYRRNILGEAGGASSRFFVTARLMMCIEQDPEGPFTTKEFKRQELMAEEIDQTLGDIERGQREEAMYDYLRQAIDLPELGQQVFLGADIGLVNDPTVVTLWTVGADAKKRTRLKLVRMFHLWRFRERMIRQVLYIIGWRYGQRLRAAGLDVSGLGLPLFQAIEDDEVAPQHLLDVTRGYVFNAKVAIGVDETLVSKDSHGQLRDAYGNIVDLVVDPSTMEERHIVKMPMIEASTRYIREFVDQTFLQLPFDTDISKDMQGETEQRVRAMAGMKKPPNAFHILDAMRVFAMAYKAADVEQQVAVREQTPVLARAVDVGMASEYSPVPMSGAS